MKRQTYPRAKPLRDSPAFVRAKLGERDTRFTLVTES